jgi:alpha-tubulin suppressor-like RCC1 family protein
MVKARLGLLLGVALIAACNRQNPVGPGPAEPERDPGNPQAVVLAAIECTVSGIEGTMSCGPATGSLVPSAIVGGQHRFVRLTSTNVATVGSTLSADVTVQNLTLLRMATSDGTTPDPNGVRVFFHTGPTNGVTVANEDGTDTFTASNQPFFQYSGAELGADQILEQGEVSSSQQWQFDLTGCGSPCTFSFTVLVSAITPDESPSARTVSLLQIDAGSFHSCGIGDDGKTYCWGDNTFGQVGDGTSANIRTTPRAVNTAETFVQVSTGDLHTCAINSGGAAFCWGEGANGRLGTGGTADQSSPAAVAGGLTFASISAGGNHTCAITSGTSRAYCWGGDGDGQLGNAAAGQQTSPDSVETALTFASISAGTNGASPFHTCALEANGNAHCWGSDSSGQLGNGAVLTLPQQTPSAVDQSTSGAFVEISAGGFHTCARTGSGAGYCWGTESNGRLGNGSTAGTQPSPVAVSGGHTFTQISAGVFHSCGIAGGAGLCWGPDGQGQLGNGATTGNQSTPQAVEGGITFAQLVAGGEYTTGREAGGQTYGWGDSTFGQVGDGRTTDQPSPVFVAATTN